MRAKITISVLFFFSGLLVSFGQDDPGYFKPVSNLTKDTVFAFDDGTQETGWNIISNHMGWLGNYFPVSASLSGTTYFKIIIR